MLRLLVPMLAFATLTAPAAFADYTEEFIHVGCDPAAGYFSAQLEAMDSRPRPAGEQYIPISAGVDLDVSGDFAVVRAGAEAVLFTCRTTGGEGLDVMFEVRRTRYLPASGRMCRGLESADIEIILNGVVIDTWPGAFSRCMQQDYRRLGPSVSYRGSEVVRCAPGARESDAADSITCRFNTPELAPAP